MPINVKMFLGIGMKRLMVFWLISALLIAGISIATNDFRRERRKINEAILRLERDRIPVNHEHSEIRKFVISAQLARVDDPIVIIGDSITEASIFPSALCGHAVINAGIGGFAVSDYRQVFKSIMGNANPILVAIALGTNDTVKANVPNRSAFKAAYNSLLAELPKAAKLLLAEVPPMESGDLSDGYLDATLPIEYNRVLKTLSGEANASFIPFPSIDPGKFTIDGVHLDAKTGVLWTAAIVRGIATALNCPRSANAGTATH